MAPAWREVFSRSAGVALSEHHRPGGSNLRGWFTIQALAGLGSPEASLLGSGVAAFLLCHLVVCLLVCDYVLISAVNWEKKKKKLNLKLENNGLFGGLAEDLTLVTSLSDSSKGRP